MKTLRTTIIGLFILVAALSASAQSNIDVTLTGNTGTSVILSENFAGDSIDPSKWSVDLPYGDSAVVVAGASCTSHNRGFLVSTDIDSNAIEINAMIKLTGNRTGANLVWKTDGTHFGGSSSTTNGIILGIYHESQSVVIGLHNGQYKQVFLPIPLDSWRQYRIVDTNGMVSLFIDGLTTPIIEFAYNQSDVGSNKKVSFFSRESAYTGPVSASITALSVADLNPPPAELIVEVAEPTVVAALVALDAPATVEVPSADVLPTITVTNAETGEVVATDVVLTGDTMTDTTVVLDSKKNHHRKAYGIIIAQRNRTKNLHCAVTEKLPKGIYVFSFQPKAGAKNVKFNANVVSVPEDKASTKKK